MAGRKPKPTQLKVIQGTARSDRQVKNEPKPTGDLKDYPDHFSPEHIEIWEYAIENAPKGLLKMLDRAQLEIWVNAYVLYRDAINKVNLTGQVVKAPSGYAMPSPYLTNANKLALTMMKAASEMGFTPASRTRISLIDSDDDSCPFEVLKAQG